MLQEVWKVSARESTAWNFATFNQVGIELIGGSTVRSDLEVIGLAARSMESISQGKYRLELCHIGYFKAIMDSLDADEDTKEEIRLLIEQKNYASLSDILGKAKDSRAARALRKLPRLFGGEEVFEKKEEIRLLIEQKNYASLSDILGKAKDSRAARALRKLPRLFGGEEVFEKAYELFDENGARESLDYLKSIYEYLRELGLGEKVIIDLGLVNLAEYYTGIIFRGYCNGIGEQILSGGRYDNLLGQFGEEHGSIGFGINVDLASQTVEPAPEQVPEILVFAQGGGRYDNLLGQFGEEHGSIGFGINVDLASQTVEPAPEQVPEILVFAQGLSHVPASVHYREQLEAQGILSENSVFDTLKETLEYAKERGIHQVHLVGEEIKEYQMEKGPETYETN